MNIITKDFTAEGIEDLLIGDVFVSGDSLYILISDENVRLEDWDFASINLQTGRMCRFVRGAKVVKVEATLSYIGPSLI